jgi:hypothetical protein
LLGLRKKYGKGSSMVGFLGLGLPSLAGVPPESQVPNTGADLKGVCRILEDSARLEYGVAAAAHKT